MPFKDAQRQKEYDHEKYLRNRTKIIARSRRRSRTHRDEIANYHRDYKEKHRDAINAYHRRWRQTMQSPESKQREREAERRWCKKNSQKRVAQTRRHRERNRLQFRARMRVSEAVQHGRLIRPTKCCECGKDCRPHAHHADYTKPLEVIWLCHGCHVKAHKGSFRNSS